MKKMMIVPILLSLLLMSGCGGTDANQEKPESAALEVEKLNEEDMEEAEAEEQQPQAVEVSIQENTVIYEGDIPFDYIAAAYDSVYLSSRDQGNGSCLMRMELEGSKAEKLLAEVPEGMEFGPIATDAAGKLHAVVINIGNSENCELWKINKAGEAEAKFDISEYMDKNDWYPWAFAVAGNGDMYLRIGGTDGILALVFDKEGNYLNRISDEEKYQMIDAIGRGRDGNIYAALQYMGDSQMIAQLDGRNGKLGNTYEHVLREGVGMYSCIGAGTDTDLLIYGPGKGIYAYNLSDSTYIRETSIAKLPFESDLVSRSTVLPDGRILFAQREVTMEGETVKSVADGSVFYYIPAGN